MAKRRKKRASTSSKCSITRVNGQRRKICRDKRGRITSNKKAS